MASCFDSRVDQTYLCVSDSRTDQTHVSHMASFFDSCVDKTYGFLFWLPCRPNIWLPVLTHVQTKPMSAFLIPVQTKHYFLFWRRCKPILCLLFWLPCTLKYVFLIWFTAKPNLCLPILTQVQTNPKSAFLISLQAKVCILDLIHGQTKLMSSCFDSRSIQTSVSFTIVYQNDRIRH